MNFRKKVLPLTMTVLLGIGTIGIANAATPFEKNRDTSNQTQHQDSMPVVSQKQNSTGINHEANNNPMVTISTQKTDNSGETDSPEVTGNDTENTYMARVQTNHPENHQASHEENHQANHQDDHQASHQANHQAISTETQNHDDQVQDGWEKKSHNRWKHSGTMGMHD